MKLLDNAEIGGSITIKTFKDGVLSRESGPFHNKVVSSDGYGRNLIMRQLAGDTTYPIAINSASIGSSGTAATDGDTNLITPVVTDIAITSISAVNNVLSVDVFIPDGTLANGTYQEFGLFATGRLIARIVISPSYTKASGEDTLISYTATFTG